MKTNGIVAHPRSRGENPRPAIRTATRPGSSPLTRGKPGEYPARRGRGRLIPAHAGKTVSLTALTASRTAHPRSRGENTTGGDALAALRGSSPLTRGKHMPAPFMYRDPGSSPLTRGKRVFDEALLEEGGLIPAHAGKTCPLLFSLSVSRAHPRSRGENTWQLIISQATVGSSPLTRGKLGITHPSKPRQRLIPAHAGKTRQARSA